LQKLAEEKDPVAQQRLALTFWDHIVDGADSIAFRLMYNTLRATYEPALAALATVMAQEVGRPDAYRELADAITAGDPPRARKAAHDLLEPATTGLRNAIDNLEEQR
jgi:GntR family transcriptional repressor for pyruvate dehydrogenase complex